jgi:hypothetical protein
VCGLKASSDRASRVRSRSPVRASCRRLAVQTPPPSLGKCCSRHVSLPSHSPVVPELRCRSTAARRRAVTPPPVVVAVAVPPTVSALCHLSLSVGPEHRLSLAAVGAPPLRQVPSGQRRRVVVPAAAACVHDQPAAIAYEPGPGPVSLFLFLFQVIQCLFNISVLLLKVIEISI